MGITLSKIGFKQDFDRIKLLHFGHFFSLLMALFLEWREGAILDFPFFQFFVIGIGYQFYYKTIRELMYSYWTFSLIFFCFNFLGMVDAIFEYGLANSAYSYLLALIFILLQGYILSSPIYYPQNNWWVIDFRYRHDLKVETTFEGLNSEGRLADLRRSAGVLTSFSNYEVGKKIYIKIKDPDHKEMGVFAIIKSKREFSIGRGLNYGILFEAENENERVAINNFITEWKKVRTKKLRLKKLDGTQIA